jgi:hypothetical protein
MLRLRIAFFVGGAILGSFLAMYACLLCKHRIVSRQLFRVLRLGKCKVCITFD